MVRSAADMLNLFEKIATKEEQNVQHIEVPLFNNNLQFLFFELKLKDPNYEVFSERFNFSKLFHEDNQCDYYQR